MSEDYTKDEILEKLKNIENKIEDQKKESFASGEDQLFFGVIISLLVLFVTLPVNDMASFLQSVFSVRQDIALTNAGYIKYFGIVLFLVSSLTRYCAVVSSKYVSRKLRYASFEALWLGVNIVILNITINLIATLSLQIGLLGLSVTFIILTSIFIGMMFLENYILKEYSQRELIPKKQLPFGSLVLLGVMAGLSIALTVETSALALGFGFSTIRFILVYIMTIPPIVMIVQRLVKRKKRSH